jgi:hypothetical protein
LKGSQTLWRDGFGTLQAGSEIVFTKTILHLRLGELYIRAFFGEKRSVLTGFIIIIIISD